METNSGNKICARKIQLLVTSALLLLQNFLIIPKIFADEISSVSPIFISLYTHVNKCE
jgi:hypothetical protein